MSMQNLLPSTSQACAGLGGPEYEGPDSSQFVAVSPSVRKLIAKAELVGPHLRFATIEGEPGAGKQTLAWFLYRQAAASNPSFAGSGLHRCDAREWLLAETDPGSMAEFTYLDRVDQLAGAGQTLLLRVLKNLSTHPAGTAILVASSEVSLRDLVSRGQFLPDLAFRLTAIRFAVPPLRERREDIVPLATHFLTRICLRCHLPGFALASDAVSRLLEHEWPGNVRELSSVLESAVLACTDGIIRAEDLCISSACASVNVPVKTSQILNLDAVIQNHLAYVLDLNHGNKLRTARQLGISRSTLYRMLEAGPMK